MNTVFVLFFPECFIGPRTKQYSFIFSPVPYFSLLCIVFLSMCNKWLLDTCLSVARLFYNLKLPQPVFFTEAE